MTDPAPWEEAQAAARRAGVALRRLDRPDDGGRIEGLTRVVWGTTEVPPPLARALQHAGAILVGADDAQGELVGCALGFIGHAGGWHCHSHLAGVVPAAEGRGIGRALKLGQRALCLELGIDEMRWTYDPLLVRNAWFNLVRLGAVATAFLPGFYGVMDDLQNRGDRGDRFEVRWSLPDPGPAMVGGSGRRPVAATPPPVRLLDAAEPSGRPEPRPCAVVPADQAEVAIPPEYARLRLEDPALAARWRSAAAHAFQLCFAQGLVATSISRGGVYRFERRAGPGVPSPGHPAAPPVPGRHAATDEEGSFP